MLCLVRLSIIILIWPKLFDPHKKKLSFLKLVTEWFFGDRNINSKNKKKKPRKLIDILYDIILNLNLRWNTFKLSKLTLWMETFVKLYEKKKSKKNPKNKNKRKKQRIQNHYFHLPK